MKFNKVVAENFKSIGAEPVEVDLNFTDVKLLLGKNGVGKSTIFDSIIWCLYGFTRAKADSIVNKTTKCGTKVELSFEENGKDYVITRYRKHKQHGNNVYIFENGTPITLKDSRQNQELIISIIGVDYKALSSSVILSSETYKNFLREKGSARLAIFESVFSLKEINIFNKKNKLKIKDLEKEINSVGNNLSNLNSSIESKLFIIKSYKQEIEDKKKKRKEELENLKERIELLRKILEKSNSININKEKENINKNKNKIEEKESLLYKKEFYENEIATLNSRNEYDRREYNKALAEMKKIENINVEAEIENIDRLNELHESLSTKKKNTDYLLLNLYNDKEAKNVELKKYNEELDGQKTRKKDLEHVNICPTCKGIIGKELHDELVEKNEAKLKELEEKISQLKDVELAKIESLVLSNEETLNELTEELKTVSTDIKNIKHSKEFLLTIEGNKEALFDKLVLNTNITINEDRISKTKEELDKIKEVLKDYENIKISDYSLEFLNDLENKNIENRISLKTLENELEQKENYKENLDTEYITKIIEAFKKESKEKEEINSIKTDLENKLKYYKALEVILSNDDSGFKKYFIENTIGLFNEKVNMFLPFFFDEDINIEFDKNLTDTITFRGEPTEFEELSSGQKTRCELSVIFSMYFLVRVLFGNGSNLLVLDEILDYNLDAEGVESVMKIIKDFSKESSVFIVSHRDEYKDNFNNVIKIFTDEMGFTKVL